MSGEAEAPRRKKGVYVGAPACFKLEAACQTLNMSFDGQCYLVGSALERADWRDIDIRLIMDDEAFDAEFPNAPAARGNWEFDAKWILLTTMLSDWLSERTGLPVDFQFQPREHANTRHSGSRNALGLIFAKE